MGSARRKLPLYSYGAMLIVRDAGELVIITQAEHSRFAGELLSLWRSDGLLDHPRRAELLFAVREHDNGWWESDSAPRVEAAGHPCDFLSIPDEERLTIWRRGSLRFAGEHPYATRLIVEHALTLHRKRREEAFAELRTELDALAEELGERLPEISAQEIAADYAWLELADTLSLAALNRWPDPVERPGRRAQAATGALRIDPFPLAGTTTFRIPCRRVPDRPYARASEFGGALARARWQTISIQVTPL